MRASRCSRSTASAPTRSAGCSQVPAWSQQYRTIVFDNRDVGQSSRADGDYAVTDMATDAISLADTLGLDSFHLLGLSMGGAISQELALAAPERVRTLTLVVTFGGGGAWGAMQGKLWEQRALEMTREQRIDELMLLCLSEATYENAEGIAFLRQMMLSNPHPQEPEAFVRQLRSTVRHETRDRLGELDDAGARDRRRARRAAAGVEVARAGEADSRRSLDRDRGRRTWRQPRARRGVQRGGARLPQRRHTSRLRQSEGPHLDTVAKSSQPASPGPIAFASAMPEIGPTLREARMRACIDITEVEDATKIRAKYLRAIENEEWSLLPGSTFVKSFVREYADYLGLDSRLLVEEYKARYERPSEHELAPIAPNLGGRDRRSDRRGGGGGGGGSAIAPRWLITGALVLILLAALWAVGSLGGSDKKGTTSSSKPTSTTPHHAKQSSGSSSHHATTTPATAPNQASVRLIPTGTVYVCLVDQSGKVLIHGETFTAGQHVPVYHAPSMRITLGNAELTLHLNGHPVPLRASSQAISYTLTPTGARPLAAAKAPTCT